MELNEEKSKIQEITKKLSKVLDLEVFTDEEKFLNCCENLKVNHKFSREYFIFSGNFGNKFVCQNHCEYFIKKICIFCVDVETHMKWAKNFNKILCVKNSIDLILQAIEEDITKNPYFKDENTRSLFANRVKYIIDEKISPVNIIQESHSISDEIYKKSMNSHEKTEETINKTNDINEEDTKNSQMSSDQLSNLKYKTGYYFDTNQSCIDYIYIDHLSLLFENGQLVPEQSQQDFLDFSRDYCKKNNMVSTYKKNKINVDMIEEIQEEIKLNGKIDDIIKKYTVESFFYKMINKILRLDDLTDIFSIRYAIMQMNRALNSIEKTKPVTELYRCLLIDEEELNFIKFMKNKPFLLRGFISTSADVNQAKKFWEYGNKKHSTCKKLLLTFKLNNKEDLQFATSISKFSAIPQEDEYLLNNNTFIVVIDFKYDNKNQFDEVLCEFRTFQSVMSFFDPLILKYKEQFHQKIYDDKDTFDKFHLASVYVFLKNYDKLYELLNSIDLSTLKPGNKATVLLLYGNYYQNKGDFKEAINYFNKGLEYGLSMLFKDKGTIGMIYENIGSAYIGLYDYDKALEYLIKSVEMLEINVGVNSEKTAESYASLGLVYTEKQNYDKALEFYNKSLSIHKSFGEYTQFVEVSYQCIGKLYRKKGELKKALEFYMKALEINEKILGQKHPDTIAAYNNIGTINISLENYEKALEILNKGVNLNLSIIGENNELTAKFYENIAIAYEYKDAEKSLEFHLKSLNIYKSLFYETHPHVAESYKSIGQLYVTTENYDEALQYFNKSLEIIETAYGKNHLEIGKLYNAIALAYQKKKNYKKALEFHFKSLELMKSIFGDRHPNAAVSYCNIGVIYAEQGNEKEALDFYLKSLNINETVKGKNSIDTAPLYTNVGMIYKKLGENKLALDYFLKAFEIYQSILGENNGTTQLVKKFMNQLNH